MDLIKAFRLIHEKNDRTVLHLVGQHKQDFYLDG